MAEQKVTKDTIVNDCIRDFPKTIGVFTEFKIDSCCGGAVSIADAAARDGADLDAMLAEINARA